MNQAFDPSCMDDYDVQSILPDEASARIRPLIQSVTETETVAIGDALDRILARDAHSTINVPAQANSAMDGYAVRGEDLPSEAAQAFTLIGTAFAGRPFAGTLERDQCVRIMTGGIIPPGADTVVIQEQVRVLADDQIEIAPNERVGQNVRAAGEDVAADSTILHAGRWLTAADIGLLASCGIAEVQVFRRLRVAFFSTGDELREIGETLDEGCIYNSNRYTLAAMLKRLHVEALDMGIIRDDRASVTEAFHKAAAEADMVITSGGVSVGEADYIKDVLDEIGQVTFWKVAIKPGRPLAFGQLGSTQFFGLPGNPVSVMVTFYQFVRPALLRLAGAAEIPPLSLQVPVTTALRKRPGRVEYQRGILSRDADGNFSVARTGAQGSGILTSMSQANCFMVLSLKQGRVEPGECVEVMPFSGLV